MKNILENSWRPVRESNPCRRRERDPIHLPNGNWNHKFAVRELEA